MKRIAIVATGGKKIGYGHFMRSKSFLLSAPLNSQAKIFAIASEDDLHLFDGIGNKVVTSQNEKSVVSQVLAFNPDIVVWDTVEFEEDSFKMINIKTRLNVSISPVFSHMNKLDILFVRNKDTPDIEGPRLYRGLNYAIFNKSCSFIPDDIYYNNLSKNHLVLGICMGGADAPNKTYKVLKALAEIELPLTIWVLLGEGYAHSYEELVKTIQLSKQHEIILAKTNRSLWSILSNCSLGIFAGGLMTVESLYAGLPSINIFENSIHQLTAGREIFEQGAAINVGIINDISIKRVKEILRDLYSERSKLLSMREKSKGLVDKLAAKRIYDIILSDNQADMNLT